MALHRIHARHFTRNPASGRVLLKLGMHLKVSIAMRSCGRNVFEDVAVYAILATQYALAPKSSRRVIYQGVAADEAATECGFAAS